jgi:hypothetical protein
VPTSKQEDAMAASNSQTRSHKARAADHDFKRGLPKVPSGIQGVYEITGDGLPRDSSTFTCGGTDCGKTLLAAPRAGR